ncbi:hypothetical protein PLICRDRAFT_170842 [Plicaturopsis crispa FD-325 SS-3]|nr:hypothetical protein PLICRDRAFT_170842 [Plicaturopsis crispa FD-325 SS-3]
MTDSSTQNHPMIVDAVSSRRWPRWTRVSAEWAEKYLQDTKNGRFDLKDVELKWRDLHPTLRRRGYRLRPRYEEDWRPSWLGTDIDPHWCEDSIGPEVYNIMDATRDDGKVVAIKRVDHNLQEVEIARLFSSPGLSSNPLNHCVPLLDFFPDPIIKTRMYLVMPILRPFDEPAFQLHGEVVDFVNQTLQGLWFMHEHHVAHRDCGALNIMMDATALYPQGWHPWRLNCAPDAISEVSPASSRIDRSKFTGLDFLLPLLSAMTDHKPCQRPTAAEALAHFRRIQAQLDPRSARWPLHPVDETLPVRVMRDTVAAAKGGISSIMSFVGQ